MFHDPLTWNLFPAAAGVALVHTVTSCTSTRTPAGDMRTSCRPTA